MGVPRLALGLSAPTPSYLTTCNPFPTVAFHHPPCVLPVPLGDTSSPRGIMLGAFCPLHLCPSWAPPLRSVLSRRRLLPALECVPPEGCLPFQGSAPSPPGAPAPPSPEDRGFILFPHPVSYCSHPWPVRLTRHCAWRRMECGGVGVGGGFPFTFWLAHFNVLAHPSPVFAQCPPTPGSLQLLHIVHLVIALYTGVD